MAGSIRQPLPLPVAAERAQRTERTIRNWIAKSLIKDAFIPDGRGGNLHVIWSDELDAFLHGATPEQLAESVGIFQNNPNGSSTIQNLTEHTRYEEKIPEQSSHAVMLPEAAGTPWDLASTLAGIAWQQGREVEHLRGELSQAQQQIGEERGRRLAAEQRAQAAADEAAALRAQAVRADAARQEPTQRGWRARLGLRRSGGRDHG